MIPFWIPIIIIRPLIFRVLKKGPVGPGLLPYGYFGPKLIEVGVLDPKP